MKATNKTNAKRLRKAVSQQNSQGGQNRILQVASALRSALEIEPLEQRLLLSGIGTGVNKKKVSFIDADGDKVTVALTGVLKGAHPSFTITLDGAASNNGDIQSIVLNGDTSGSALSIMVKPVKIQLPNTTPGITHGHPYTFSAGFTEVSLISSNSSLRGISANSAALDNIVFGDATHTANIGSIAIDIGKSQFYGTPGDPLSRVGLGNVTDFGHIGSIVLHGRTNLTNNLTGTITATAGIDSINAPFSDLLGPVIVTGATTGTGSTAGFGLFNLNVHDLLANVTVTGNIGSVQANNLLGAVQTTGGFNNLVLQGNFIGNVTAAGAFGNSNVNGNWSGMLSAGSVGNLLINGTSFTGTVEATAGNIGNITVSQSGVAFGAHVSATGNIGNLSAGAFSGADVEAGGNIGNIASTSVAGNLPQGLTSGIDGSTFHAVGSIGNINSVASITGTTVIAGGAIGNITSTAGNIGGSMGWAQFLSAGYINLHVTGPAADFIQGASIGNITSHGDISGNVITATVGNIGNITSQEGRIAFDTVTAEGSIGNISATSQHASLAFDSAGNLILGSAYDSSGSGGQSLLNISASAIQGDTFTAKTGTIGNITASAPNVGGSAYVGLWGVGGVQVSSSGIAQSVFTAYAGIGNISATAAGHNRSDYGIVDGTFTVTGTGLAGKTAIGNVTASAVGGDGIFDSTFHAVSGNIANVSGTSIYSRGIGNTHIIAETGNVGVVSGTSLGASNDEGGDGLEDVTIQAGQAGSGAIAGIVGHSVTHDGIDSVHAYAGTGGIGYIKGTSTGAGTIASGDGNGIEYSTFHTTGSIGDITGSGNANNGIYYSYFYAGANIGNIVGRATGPFSGSGIEQSIFHAGFSSTGAGAIASVTGTSAGYGSGIENSSFYANTGIGAIVGASTSNFGDEGIEDSFFNADYLRQGIGAITSIKGTGVNDSGIESSTFLAGAGIGPVYGASTGPYGEDGISGSTFNGDIDHNGVGGIGNITGISLAKTGSGSGIINSRFYAGDTIGNVLGTTTAPGNSAGIRNSSFFANAGSAATTGGKGSIGTITGTSTGIGYGPHYGIDDSYFGAGNGIGGNGTIGNISGVATATNGTGSVSAYGIYNTSFLAGIAQDGTGSIGNVDGNATATANGFNSATAAGIAGYTYIQAGGLSGTIGTVSGEGVATSANSSATAYGIRGPGDEGGLQITAGPAANGTGTIAGVTGTATATGVTATAYGIYYGYIRAGNGVGGTGTVGNITGTGTANSTTGSAWAYGIYSSYVYVGQKLGTVANITGTATATSTGGSAYSYGIEWLSAYVGYGHGKVNGTGTIGAISGSAIATAAGNANATGIEDANVYAGWHDGSIASVSGTATATTTGSTSATSVSATAEGIDDSDFNAGYGYSTGTIGDVTGKAYAYGSGGGTSTKTTVSATAYGLEDVGLFAAAHHLTSSTVTGDFGTGSIGNISGVAKATVTSGYNTSATAKGIFGLTAIAADGDYSVGTIASVSGSGTATATGDANATASAWGITGSGSILAGSGFHGNGTITSVTGNATATANTKGDANDLATANATGLSGETIGVGTGSYGTGTIGSVDGHGFATATGGSTKVTAIGFGSGLTITVGGTKTNPAFAPVISDSAKAYAYSAYGNATATAKALDGITINTGTNTAYGIGYVGAIYGKATATAKAMHGNAYAYAYGINNVTVNVGGTYKGKGTIASITGIAVADARSYGLKGIATAEAYGINDSTFRAGYAYAYGYTPKAFGGGSGASIGNITGTATATAIAPADEAVATARAHGIEDTYAGAGNAIVYVTEDGTGLAFGGSLASIGNVLGTGTAVATATGFNGIANATGVGIQNLTLSVANATVNTSSSYPGGGTAYGGTGTIGTVTGTGSAIATGGAVGSGAATSYAAGITGLFASAADATSSYNKGQTGRAYGGVGHIDNITGTAVSDATAAGKYTTASATTYGIKNATITAGNSVGYTTAKGAVGGTSSIGDITGTATHAYATGGKSATARAQGLGVSYYGYGGVTVSAGIATASKIAGTATASNGTIGNLGGSGVANATATNGLASSSSTSYASGIKNLDASAATASGLTATGGTGIIGTLTGSGKATATGGTASATAYGIDPSSVGAGGSTVAIGSGSGPYIADTSIAGAGTIGNVYGYALANASGFAATGYSAGITGLTLNAGSAYTNVVGDKAVAAPGTIGTITGKATTNVTGSDSAYDVVGYGIGIEDLRVYAGTANSSGTATGAAGTVGDVTAAAYVTVNGKTTGSSADVSGEAIALVNSTFTVGSASGGYGAGYTATAGKGSFGNVNVKATLNLTGTTSGSSSQVVGSTLGISDVHIDVSNASGYTAVGGNGTVGNFTATVNSTIVGTTTANGTGSDDVDVTADTTRGTNELYVRVSNAHGSYSTGGSATAGNGTVGSVSATTSATLTGTTSGDYGHVRMNMEGIEDTHLEVSNAYGFVAAGGTGSVGAITGNSTSTTTGTTSGKNADVFNDETRGIDDTYAIVSNAYGYAGKGGSATAGNGTVGAFTGTGTSTVTGTTKGDNSGVWNNETVGIEDGNIYVSNAVGYTAKGGTGTVGGQVGTASATVTGTTSGKYADVYTKEIRGLYETDVSVSNATGSYSKGGSGTAGGATVGALSGTATASVTGTTTGDNSDVYADQTYGIDLYSDDGAYIRVSNGKGFVAKGGAAVFSTITGSATVTVKGTTSGSSSDVYADSTYGIDSANSITIGNATGYGGKGGAATGGSVTIGNISGTANATVNGTTTGDYADVSSTNAFGIDNPSLILGNASAYTATGGAVTLGTFTGSATVIVTGTTSGKYSDIYANYTNGIDNPTITAGNATGYAGKGGAATAGKVTVGDISGTAKATVTGKTTGYKANVYSSDAFGIDNPSLSLGNASAYTATGGAVILGTFTGSATVSVTGTTSGKYSSVFADVYGIDNPSITAANASTGSYAVGTVAKAGAFTMGAITGTASATVVGTTSGNYLTVNADDVSGIDGSISITAGNASSAYKAYGGAITIGAITGTATATATGTTGGGKYVTLSARRIYGVNDLSISVGNATGYLGKGASGAGVGTAGVVTIGAISGSATASATHTSTYKGGNKVYTSAYGVLDTTITAGNAVGYNVTSGAVTLTGVKGVGTATSSGAYGKQTVKAISDGVSGLTETISGVTGTKITAGKGNAGYLTGTATASATGYFATATAKGLDPIIITAGSGTEGKGYIGAVTGTATATATGDATVKGGFAYSFATGISGLTLNAATGSKGAGTIGNITGNGKAVQTAAGGGAQFGSGYGIATGAFSAGGSKGSGSIGNIIGTGYSSKGFSAGIGEFTYGPSVVTANTVGNMGNVNGYGSTAAGATYGIKNSSFATPTGNIAGAKTTGSFFRSNLLAGSAAADGFSIGTVNISVGTLGGPGAAGHGIVADTLTSVTVGGTLVTDPENDTIVGADVRIVQL